MHIVQFYTNEMERYQGDIHPKTGKKILSTSKSFQTNKSVKLPPQRSGETGRLEDENCIKRQPSSHTITRFQI